MMALVDSIRSSTCVTCADPARRAPTRGRVAAALLALRALAAGCARNAAPPYLAPTGGRPAPAQPTGATWGYVRYDPTQRPDLVDPPYPPTTVDLLRASD